MIIQRISLKNFGVYKHAVFDLEPKAGTKYTRPITLVRGKNGVGKTTIMDGIRLCLHGSLALGSRVGQKEYEQFLLSKIHRTSEDEIQANLAELELHFDFVGDGRKTNYKIVRSWGKKGKSSKSLDIYLDIYEDSRPLKLTQEEKEHFLRELISPGLVELFFFDGEKIRTLAADDEDSNQLLANTVKTLLGLDIVDQLLKDLDIFLMRQKVDETLAFLQSNLAQLHSDKEKIETELSDCRDLDNQLTIAIDQLKSEIQQQEQTISNAGGKYADAWADKTEQKNRLEAALEIQKRKINDQFNGLLPFAFVPELLLNLKTRLHDENQVKAQLASQQLVEDGINNLQHEVKKKSVLKKLGMSNTPTEPLIELIKEVFKVDSDLAEIVLDVSDQEQQLLLSWTEEALSNTPQTFAESMGYLRSLESELQVVKDDLSRVPDKAGLKPLLEKLGRLQRDLGTKQDQLQKTKSDIDRLTNREIQIVQRQNTARQEIEKQEIAGSKLHLALRSQKALTRYKSAITSEKVVMLETKIKNLFNTLCRKPNFLEDIKIDPDQFTISLRRLGQPFQRSQLSAGEQQLFATATLWALREISGRPMPVLIDTPLSRLDSEHRLSMSQEFFPHVSHQVIVLATDAEVDEELATRLESVTSHVYNMTLDSASGTTQVSHYHPNSSYADVSLEEIGIS